MKEEGLGVEALNTRPFVCLHLFSSVLAPSIISSCHLPVLSFLISFPSHLSLPLSVRDTDRQTDRSVLSNQKPRFDHMPVDDSPRPVALLMQGKP